MAFTCSECGQTIEGTNCAFTLSVKMGWKNISGCYGCKCGYPVRCAELMKNVFCDEISNPDKNTSVGFQYMENSSNERHVYYGTFYNCEKGNGLAMSGISGITKWKVFSLSKY